jgi:hypothetical protein
MLPYHTRNLDSFSIDYGNIYDVIPGREKSAGALGRQQKKSREESLKLFESAFWLLFFKVCCVGRLSERSFLPSFLLLKGTYPPIALILS